MATKQLVVVVGPTGSGKTGLAIELAKKVDGEIICADSRTIYKGMDIITAKPNFAEMQKIRHFGLDLVNPDQKYSVKDFQAYTNQKIKQIRDRAKVPILVGGSGLYINSVVFDYSFPEITQEITDMPLSELQKIVKDKGYEVSEQVFKNQRHLMGVIKRGGAIGTTTLRPDTIILGINPGLEVLKTRINRRVDEMFEAGAVREVEGLIKKYGDKCAAFNAPGFKPIQRFISGEVSMLEAKALFVKADIYLAKKQMKWFKRYPQIIWFSSSSELLSSSSSYEVSSKSL